MVEHIITTPIEEQKRVENLPFKLPKHIIELLDGFKWATREKNTSVVILIDGKSGRGKTTLSGQIAAYCDKDYMDKEINLKKIHWNPETFVNGQVDEHGNVIKIGLAQAQPGDCVIFDEAMLVSSRSFMSEVNRMIVIAMSMIRSKRIVVIFNVNSFFDLDRNLSIFRSELLLHVYGDSLTDRGKVMAFFQAADKKDNIKNLYIIGKKYYDYSQPHSNFNTTFPKYFVFDEVKYETQKQIGVNAFLNKKSTSFGSKRGEQHAQQRNRAIFYIKENTNLTLEEISNIVGIGYEALKAVLYDPKRLQNSIEDSARTTIDTSNNPNIN